jgi:hypothetical protein
MTYVCVCIYIYIYIYREREREREREMSRIRNILSKTWKKRKDIMKHKKKRK